MGAPFIIRNRSRQIRPVYQVGIEWPARGSGISWFNADHSATKLPLYTSRMFGAISSLTPLCDSLSYDVDDIVPNSLEFKLEWVDSSGAVISRAALEVFEIFSEIEFYQPFGQFSISMIDDGGTLPSGLKQTVTTTGTVGAGGWQYAMMWLGVYQ